jgi:hypothetical protein
MSQPFRTVANPKNASATLVQSWSFPQAKELRRAFVTVIPIDQGVFQAPTFSIGFSCESFFRQVQRKTDGGGEY